uniref:Stp1/IreP family PP2C-type Ser/Thr phosphatase n=1 Tax=Agathobacter sp. TaxID=2021311 RepID=UPI00405729EB
MKAFSMTDTGIRRTMNQDYCFASNSAVGNLPNLYIVSDGMGGHKAGDYASRYTVERVVASASRNAAKDPVKILRDAITKANEILVTESREDENKRGMGTTIVAATIMQNKMYVANVGDSRLYVINNGIRQITWDHSYVEEMVRRGQMNPEEARNHSEKHVITRAVGADRIVEPDFFEVELKKDDIVLLCSDGLSNMVTDERIYSIVSGVSELQTVVKRLIDEANFNGGSDNITAVLVKPYSDEVRK